MKVFEHQIIHSICVSDPDGELYLHVQGREFYSIRDGVHSTSTGPNKEGQIKSAECLLPSYSTIGDYFILLSQ